MSDVLKLQVFHHTMQVRGNGWMGILLCGWMAAALCLLVCYPDWGGTGGGEWWLFLFAHGGPLLIDLHSLYTVIYAGVVA